MARCSHPGSFRPRVLETIDERLLRCGVSRRSFLQFCSSLMVAAPFGLSITDKKTPEEVAQALGKHRPPVIWLHFQDCTGCTETLLAHVSPRPWRFDPEIISLEYHETLMAGSGRQAEKHCRSSSQVLGQVRLRRRRFDSQARQWRLHEARGTARVSGPR